MKIVNKISAFVLASTAIATGAFGSDLLPSNFCGGDAINVVCTNFSYNSLARRERIRQKKASVESFAVLMLKQQFGFPSFVKTMEDVRRLQIPFIVRLNVYEAYRKNIALTQNIVNWGAEETQLRGHIESIKGFLLDAIDAQFPVPNLTGLQMKVAVNHTQVIMATAIGEVTNVAHRKQLATGFEKACGVDGLGDNAFAAKTPDGAKYLVVCPGLMIGSSAGSNDPRTNLENLLQTLGHEWGHHIDASLFPAVYQAYAECFYANYANRLAPIDPMALFTEEQRRAIPPNHDFNAANNKVGEHLSEMIGDFWGNQVVAQYLKRNALFLTQQQKLFTLRESYGALCGSADEGIHPTGDFRIGLLTGEDPAIRQELGCGGSFGELLRKRACTLKGLHDPLALRF